MAKIALIILFGAMLIFASVQKTEPLPAKEYLCKYGNKEWVEIAYGYDENITIENEWGDEIVCEEVK